jgi:beta-glucanase (GH16 family)
LRYTWQALAAILLVATFLGCAEESESVGYGIVWRDEFDGELGQLPDPTRWGFDVGTDWGNLQLEFDTDRAENVSLDGKGNLAITAREENFAGQSYTAGRIKTMGLFQQARGRFEARIQMPVGQGIWPAFWLLGANIDEVGWPQCGEIDIAEYRGQEPRVLHGTIHGPGYQGDASLGSKHVLAQGGFHLGFHVFAIEWDEDSITWQVDGHTYHSIGSADLPRGTEWVFNKPFFILLNVAVGGRWVGSPDENTVFPQTMLVDWVRVHGPKP